MAEPALPPILAGRYRPVRLIGRGGMGSVYEVEHTNTGERLALKLLQTRLGGSVEALERFKREARASARIKSENIVRVTDAGVAPELEDSPYLVMELLDGKDLEELASTRILKPEYVVDLLRPVARALDKAHRLGIVHRDLKPENLFLATLEDGRDIVKIVDFGIAKMAEDGGLATSSGQVLGTPRYMAPEQAQGSKVSPKTDLFALGLIAFRLLVGAHYYRRETVVALLAEVLHEPIQRPSERGSELGERFDEWFLKACNKEPESRFESAYEAIEALAEAFGAPRVAAPIEPRPPSSSAPALREGAGSDPKRFGEESTIAAPVSGSERSAPRVTPPALRAEGAISASIGGAASGTFAERSRTPWAIAGGAVVVAIGTVAYFAISTSARRDVGGELRSSDTVRVTGTALSNATSTAPTMTPAATATPVVTITATASSSPSVASSEPSGAAPLSSAEKSVRPAVTPAAPKPTAVTTSTAVAPPATAAPTSTQPAPDPYASQK